MILGWFIVGNSSDFGGFWGFVDCVESLDCLIIGFMLIFGICIEIIFLFCDVEVCGIVD